MDEADLRNMMYTAQLPDKGPYSIRYPRGNGVTPEWKTELTEIPTGTGRLIKDGNQIAILSIGAIGNLVSELKNDFSKENLSVAHYDMRFVKPIDEKLLHSIFKKFNKIITLEDGVIKGGFGSAVIEFMSENNYHAHIKRLGIPDKFIEHGTQKELYNLCGYDTVGIFNTVKQMLNEVR